jgi:hypothetical protein
MDRRKAWWVVVLGMSLAVAGGGGPLRAAGFEAGAYTDTQATEDVLEFGPDTRATQLRQRLLVPKAYGRLVGVTGSGGVARF